MTKNLQKIPEMLPQVHSDKKMQKLRRKEN